MDKLKLIIRREFLAKVRNKSFIILTVLSPVLIVGLIMLIVFLNEKNSEDKQIIGVVNDSQLNTAVFKNTGSINYVDLTPLGLEQALNETKNSYDGLLYIPRTDKLEAMSSTVTYYSGDPPSLNLLMDMESVLETAIRNMKIRALDIDIEQIRATETQVTISAESFSGETSSKVGSVLRMMAGGAFGYLIFMFIIIYGTSVMRSVIEEKTSRIIEVIISSVKPFQLMLGKIIGNALAGLLQFVIWMISAGLLLFLVTSIFGIDSQPVTNDLTLLDPEMAQQVSTETSENVQQLLEELKTLPILTLFFAFIIYFIGGYLTYSSIYAAIGAAVDSETDTQQFMLPVLMPLIIAIYIGFSIIENPHGPIALGFSIFPLTSPIVMLMRIPFGVPWWQIALSIGLLVLTFIGMVWMAAKIYRVGILMYGKRPTYKELYKWLKY
jgi:ABC-2 type transport system permease protein